MNRDWLRFPFTILIAVLLGMLGALSWQTLGPTHADTVFVERPLWTFDTTGGEMYKMLPPLDTVVIDPSPPAFTFEGPTIRGWFCRDSLWTPTDTLLPRDTTVDTPSGPYRIVVGARCP